MVGFAAETEKVIEHAKAKLKRKGCDWIVANDVSAQGGAMGGDDNAVHLITASGVESWPAQSKDAVAQNLVARIAAALGGQVQMIDVEVMRLPHGADLPLPAYQSDAASGLDLLAAVPADAPLTIAPGRYAAVPTGIAIALAARAARRRCGRARASRASTASPCSTRPARSTPTIAARSRCC